MKSKIVWVVVSCLMALSLLMVSCAPAVTEEEEVVAPPVEEEVVTEEEVAPAPEGPLYGGVIRQFRHKSFGNFDPAIAGRGGGVPLTHEELLTGDWTKSAAGTGEVAWVTYSFYPPYEVGCLAESWEIPDEETLVFHIRQGVYFHNKPPVNGRELTADDVVFSIQRCLDTTMCDLNMYHPAGAIKSVTAPDKWTVVVKCIPQDIQALLRTISDGLPILPIDGGGEYPGNFQKWETSCGTGPFMLIDYVSDSSATYVKNPDYWRKDPLYPENTLPYIDGVDVLIIVDASTQRAAFRVGKIENCSASWEEAPILWETNPEAKWRSNIQAGPSGIAMRIDTKPFDDIRVRRALAMGIDNQAIKDELYGGNADILWWPILPIPLFSDMYTPLEEQPEEIRELYEYHPDKARQLLAEAGYPDGFKTEILCGTGAGGVDMLSLLKEYWAKIGVDLEIQSRSHDAIKSLLTQKKHTAMVYTGFYSGDPQNLVGTYSKELKNYSMVNDSKVEDMYARVQANLYEPEYRRILKEEYAPYALEHCWYIMPPGSHGFRFWQPWLQRYNGESGIGYQNKYNWPMYVSLDQEMKKEITGR